MKGLGELEAAIMDRLWSGGPATVREILVHLSKERSVAYTTVMTVMDRLYRKEILSREPEGRAFRYTPMLSREAHTARLMTDALAGSPDRRAAIAHFVADADAADVTALRQALSRLGRSTGSHRGVKR